MSNTKSVVMTFGPDRIRWAFPAASGRFKDAQVFDLEVLPGGCPMCSKRAIVPLPPPVLAVQPDNTTHVCHPALGGCNHGFAK